MNDELVFRAATSRTTPDEDAEVSAWMSGSSENEQRVQDTVEVLRLAADADDALAFGPAPTAAEMLAGRGAAVHRGGGGDRRRRVPWAWLVPIAAAATLAIALPLGLLDWTADPTGLISMAPLGSDEFVTEAEPATVGLRDGSVVRLAPASRLRVHTTEHGREVSLTGRGYFAVAADPEQPFTVNSDAGTVTVLGTRFDITVADGDLRVIVIEGSVRLSARGSQVVVGAGQLAQVLGGNLVPPVDVPDPTALVGWVGNFIAFHDTPLRDVVREIEQRYDVRVAFSDSALGDRTVTALFAGRSYEEIAEVICVVAHLRCTRVGDVLNMAPAR